MLGLPPAVLCGVCFWYFPLHSLLIAGFWVLYFCYRTKIATKMIFFGKHAQRRNLPKLKYHVMHEGRKENDRVLWFFHGWPDNKEIFEKQYAYFGAQLGYTCVACDMPLYARTEGFDSFGYSIEELADMIKSCVLDFRASLKGIKKRSPPMTFVTFDWGCFVGGTCEKLLREQGGDAFRPDSIVFVDIGSPGGFKVFSSAFLSRTTSSLGVVILGLIYQWFLIFCFHLSLFGKVFGGLSGRVENMVYNLEHFTLFQRFPSKVRALKEEQAKAGDKPYRYPPPIANYIYFHFNLCCCLSFLGLRSAPVEVPRSETGDDKIPTFFIYGADKVFNFHFPKWCKALLKKNEKSRVVGLRSDWAGVEAQKPIDEIKQTREEKVGHWSMVTLPQAFNGELEAWLKTL